MGELDAGLLQPGQIKVLSLSLSLTPLQFTCKSMVERIFLFFPNLCFRGHELDLDEILVRCCSISVHESK
jgi:hypothetical protein